jgi:hypothetical protein
VAKCAENKLEPQVFPRGIGIFVAAQRCVQIISPEFAEKAGKVIHSIEHTLSPAEFEVIGPDSFVDIELP